MLTFSSHPHIARVFARGQRLENPDRAKNHTDSLPYSLGKKNKKFFLICSSLGAVKCMQREYTENSSFKVKT